MVRTTKNDKTSVPTPSATMTSAPVLEPVVNSTEAVKTKKPRAPASKKAVVEAPVVELANEVVSQPVVSVEPVAEVADVVVMSNKLSEFSSKLQQLTALFSAVKSDYKTLEKLVAREFKNAQKSSSKRKKSGKNRQPSGFVKPTRISDELAVFLGKTIGAEMARTDVSKEINQYIRLNSLQDKTNGRKIIPDQKLAVLLNIGGDEELTYFNLQRYMKHHFIKADVLAAAAASATTSV
jgi:chromatin remodeling complex protein RSC6